MENNSSFNFVGSILPNTNKIISESDADWSGIREGNLVKFKSDNISYHAVKTEPFFYIRDFTAESGESLVIDDNTSIFLHLGDDISVSYKEYELLTIFKIINGGSGYNNGDVLFLEGGVPSSEISDGASHKTRILVLETLPGGIITKVSVEDKGKYIVMPEKQSVGKGGTGNGAKFEVDFKLLDIRAVIDRNILQLSPGDKTKITLTYPIPAAVKEGKISVRKTCLTLSSNYQGKSQFSNIFHVARDFTMNYNWPLLTNNSFASNILMNKNLQDQDKLIKEIEEKIDSIKELEGRIERLEKLINV